MLRIDIDERIHVQCSIHTTYNAHTAYVADAHMQYYAMFNVYDTCACALCTVPYVLYAIHSYQQFNVFIDIALKSKYS